MQCKISQPFGGNATSTYKAGGLQGHSGSDSSCGFGSPIYSVWDSEYVYKVLTKENPANDGSGFTGIFTIVEQDGKVFEFLYGHCNPSPNLLGKTLKKGDLIGTEANNGEVYSNGVRITLEMQRAGDKRGSHRHDQARELRKDTTTVAGTRYLTTLGGGLLFLNDCFYAIPNYNNGYNGCFDFTSMLKEAPKVPQHFTDFQNALKTFQEKEGIKPFPLVGNQTRRALNKYLPKTTQY